MKMTAVKLSQQEEKELEKFTRMLSYKIAQVVVQSRFGEKVKTKSKPYSETTDWFNLSITDVPEVQAMARTALEDQTLTNGLGMCVEISLKTVDGDSMVLETWYLEMTDQIESNARVGHAYYRMSVMLKSLIVMTRITPAYKLSAMQGPNSFVICYRVYMGDPLYNSLGDNYQRLKVSHVETPLGTLLLSVVYRTQMTISPQKVNKEGMFMVKSDHFNPDMSPKCPHRPCGPSHNGIHVLDQKSVMDELASACEECQDDSTNRYSNPQPSNAVPVNGCIKKTSPVPLKNGDTCPNNITERQVSFSECMKVGAFAGGDQKRDLMNGCTDNADYIMPDPPFINLLKTVGNLEKTVTHHNSLNSRQTNGRINYDKPDNNFVETDDMQRSKSLMTSCMDDFVMVDLKPPFACGDEATDLGAFFRECQTAPQLLSFSEQPSFADQVNELGLQLAKFETSAPDLDDFVESLCLDETK